MSNNPKIDDKIDNEVNHVLERMATEAPKDFAARVKGLSKAARAGLKVAVAEQIAVEGDGGRKAKLQELQQHLNQ